MQKPKTTKTERLALLWIANDRPWPFKDSYKKAIPALQEKKLITLDENGYGTTNLGLAILHHYGVVVPTARGLAELADAGMVWK